MPGSPVRPSADPSRPLDPQHLEALLAVLLTGTELAPGDPPRIVRVRVDAEDLAGGELELGLHALDEGDHPIDALTGFRAPDGWSALGVLATGKASHLTGQGRRHQPARPAAVVVGQLVARDGSWASAWRPVGPKGPAGGDCGRAAAGLACTGRIDDALRRALGVPTGPPPASTQVLWATQWLDDIVALGATRPAGRHRLTTPEVLALHPVVPAFDVDAADLTVDRLVADADRLARWRTWAQLRAACAEGTWPDAGLDADLAEWFDDGSFARCLLGRWPELPDLVDAIHALLAPTAAAAVEQALGAWGLVGDAAT